MTEITTDMVIGKIIIIKGELAGDIIDSVLCGDEKRTCCPGTTLQLEAAAELKGVGEELPKLLKNLNSLPDSPLWKVYSDMI